MVTSDYKLTEPIKTEHTRAELQRLDAGMTGCGCSDCQALYKTLDLNKYANRVSDSGDTILIAEKSRQSSRVDDVSSSPESVCLLLPDKVGVFIQKIGGKTEAGKGQGGKPVRYKKGQGMSRHSGNNQCMDEGMTL